MCGGGGKVWGGGCWWWCLNDGFFKRKFSNPFPFFFLYSSDVIHVKECWKTARWWVISDGKVGAFDVMRPYATPAILSPLPTVSPNPFPNQCNRFPSCSGFILLRFPSAFCFLSLLSDSLLLVGWRRCAHTRVFRRGWLVCPALLFSPVFFFFPIPTVRRLTTIASNFLACLCPWEEDAAFRTPPPRTRAHTHARTHEPLHNTHTYTDTQQTHTRTRAGGLNQSILVFVCFTLCRYFAIRI